MEETIKSDNKIKLQCRCCMIYEDEVQSKMLDIFGNDLIVEKLRKCTSLEITVNDSLPNTICTLCHQKLENTIEFRSMCRYSDQLLRENVYSKYEDELEKIPTKTFIKSEPVLDISPLVLYDINDAEPADPTTTVTTEVKREFDMEEHLENRGDNMDIMYINELKPLDPTVFTSEIKKLFIMDINNDICENVQHSTAEYPDYIINEDTNLEMGNKCTITSKSEFHNRINTIDESQIKPRKKLSESESDCEIISPTLDMKSKLKYEKAYKKFNEWCNRKKTDKLTENVLLAYFVEKSLTVKSSTLWALYSMLKMSLILTENINISRFPKIIQFIKKKSVGYQARKSKSFTIKQINKFLDEACDESYLLLKVALIFGVSGGCGRHQLVKLTVNDIKDMGSILIVHIPDTNPITVHRTFIINNIQYINIYRKYAALRPLNVTNSRFFLKYMEGKCSIQVVGINSIGTIPGRVAKFLKLPNIEDYSGLSFKKTYDTLQDVLTSSSVTKADQNDESDSKLFSADALLTKTNTSNSKTDNQNDDSDALFTKTVFEKSMELSESESEVLKTTANLKLKYERAYNIFIEWRNKNGKETEKITENILLEYFVERSITLKSSSLWSLYSMLKAALNIKENIDLRTFSKLILFIKKKSVGFKSTKTKSFTSEQINRFLTEASDENYLFMKVALIIGTSVKCACNQLVQMTVNNIKDVGSILIIEVPDLNTKNINRTFTIHNKQYIEIYRKYAALRPSHVKSSRFFTKYLNGKCYVQLVGVNTISGVPIKVAKFLKLPNADEYNGHSFKKSWSKLR